MHLPVSGDRSPDIRSYVLWNSKEVNFYRKLKKNLSLPSKCYIMLIIIKTFSTEFEIQKSRIKKFSNLGKKQTFLEHNFNSKRMRIIIK